jgi:hypothetical protein
MVLCEAFEVAKSDNQPIVHIGPSECSLNSLQQEDKISCTKFALTLQNFQIKLNTNLKILRVVGHLGNCSYTRLNLGEWAGMGFREWVSYRFGRRERHREPS